MERDPVFEDAGAGTGLRRPRPRRHPGMAQGVAEPGPLREEIDPAGVPIPRDLDRDRARKLIAPGQGPGRPAPQDAGQVRPIHGQGGDQGRQQPQGLRVADLHITVPMMGFFMGS